MYRVGDKSRSHDGALWRSKPVQSGFISISTAMPPNQSHQTCLIAFEVRIGCQEVLSCFNSQDSRLWELSRWLCCFWKCSFLSCLLFVNTRNNKTNSLPKGNTVHMKKKCLLQVSTWHSIVPNSLERLARIIVSAVTIRCVITPKYFYK